ncbi:hypothetical protein NDU88_007469 [Pleurodeles waltl]|uniref:Uncharacterized protein n=1 Tax=Pleurodeles waltl TaxID=8319 RepID=A0AAV7RQE0_PLEWA|nr:hypothetical protein NDU88_007469 [Pleurodeles waltl]
MIRSNGALRDIPAYPVQQGTREATTQAAPTRHPKPLSPYSVVLTAHKGHARVVADLHEEEAGPIETLDVAQFPAGSLGLNSPTPTGLSQLEFLQEKVKTAGFESKEQKLPRECPLGRGPLEMAAAMSGKAASPDSTGIDDADHPSESNRESNSLTVSDIEMYLVTPVNADKLI